MYATGLFTSVYLYVLRMYYNINVEIDDSLQGFLSADDL